MVRLKLLATKLHLPARPEQWVSRPLLSQRLQAGLNRNRPLILVSAPAGFGKTSAISAWAHTLDMPVAWLSLDAGDDDPGRFFTYLISALQMVDASLGREIEAVLNGGQLPPAEVISAMLGNDMLATPERFLLVLDDFHVIQDAVILQVLETVIVNPPPSLHMTIITREDPPLPLARLRANSRLTEIRAQDLRFTVEDTARFLQALGLSLSAEEMTALEQKTEGWIAGLQLAAIALQSATVGQSDPADFIAKLSGSHRFILSYLTEQVLDQQPEAVRQFLLQTAVLDRLHGDLCDAVTGRADSRSMLERLFKANLFLIPLDDVGQWYRYHHLFADLLRDRQRVLLAMEETAVLHQRASRWYTQENRVNEAIHHALAAADYDTAVDLLEDHAMRLIMQGYVKTVNGWVEAIPAQWQSHSPKTHLAFAWMHLLRGAYAQAMPYLERLEAALSAPPSQQAEMSALKAEWLVLRSLQLSRAGKAPESLALAEEAQAICPEGNDRVWSLVYFALATARLAAGDENGAVTSYHQAIQVAQAAGNHVADMLSTSGLAEMAFERGQLLLASEIAVPASDRIERSGAPPPISTVLYGILGEVFYQWVQIKQGQRAARRALQLSALGGYASGLIGCRVLLSRLSQLAGDLAAAADEMQAAADMLQPDTPDYVRQEAVAQQVRLYLARRRPAAAEMVLSGEGFSFKDGFVYPEIPAETPVSHALGLLYNSSLRLLLYGWRNGRSPTSLQAGLALADPLITIARLGQKIPVALEAYLLRAQMQAALGDPQAAQADYIRALELAEPEGFIGVFVEQGPPVIAALSGLEAGRLPNGVTPGFIKRILDACARLRPPDTAVQPQSLVEPLTERELEVLHLMAAGLKYSEIAARLFISLNTVRYHVKALYGKLNVNNRTQAIAAARRHKIL